MFHIKREGDSYKGTGFYLSPIKDWYYNFNIGFLLKTSKKKTLWYFRINPKLKSRYATKIVMTREQFDKNLEHFPEMKW